MAKSAKYLLIGSTKPYSGKTAIALGLAHQFRGKGLNIAYGKPLGTELTDPTAKSQDADVQFVAQTLQLSEDQVRLPLQMLTPLSIESQLQAEQTLNDRHSLQEHLQGLTGDVILLEGPGTLQQGRLLGLSLPQMARELDAAVLLVERLETASLIDNVLFAQEQLGDHLLGILMNDLSVEQQDLITTQVQPFLERQGISVMGMLPQNALLRSVSVAELVKQLQAQVLCGADHLATVMVESLRVGAMNVSAAMKYFDQVRNMAVVTGGDRKDIQLAALEKHAHCLILTGQIAPDPKILTEAEHREVPVLCVDLDTLTTVEIIDRAFGQVRLHEPSKVKCITQLMAEHFEINQFMTRLGVEAPVSNSVG